MNEMGPIVDVPHAVWIDRYGSPEELTYGPISLPSLAAGDVRVRTIAAAVNHTDLEIRAGNWPIRNTHPFPYIPGVEVVGEVFEVGSNVEGLTLGDIVITMMQGLGGVRAERTGGYQTHVTVSAKNVALVPNDADPLGMAALGLGAVTALEGLRRLGELNGRRVLVTGAAGGVGSSGVSIARAMGAIVTGIVTRPEQVEAVRRLRADEVIVTLEDGSAVLEPAGFDGILDTVGAALFPSYLPAIRDNGTLSVVGAVSGGDVSLDLWNLIKPVTLTGYSSENLTGARLREDVISLATWLREGKIAIPQWSAIPLQEAARAHALLERRAFRGRVLLVT